MVSKQNTDTHEAHQVYDRHVKPTEDDHRGEYVLVTPDGETVFAPTLAKVFQYAHERSNPSNYIFKVGDVALGKIR